VCTSTGYPDCDNGDNFQVFREDNDDGTALVVTRGSGRRAKLDTRSRGMMPRLQRRRNMIKRKVLAAATLVALPMLVGAAQSVPEPVATRTETAHTWQMTDRHAGPQWIYAFGMDGGEALAFGVMAAVECSFFGPWGGLACGITGAL